MVEHENDTLGIKKKCELLDVSRSTVYYKPRDIANSGHVIMNEILDIYQKASFYGYRKITVELRKRGFKVNHKRVQSLMASMGMQAVYAKKKTTIKNPLHKVFPYLLQGFTIDRPNQVWQVDITYIKIRHGFVYLVCLLDVFSRRIMGWSLSTFLDTASCLEALSNALKLAVPEIINSDQGCQFTSVAWVEELTKNMILISMDGKGRWVDNVFIERLWRTIKYENVFLHSFDTVSQARVALSNFIHFYNNERSHQALNYHTPDAVYALKRVPTKQELFEQFKFQAYATRLEAAMTPK